MNLVLRIEQASSSGLGWLSKLLPRLIFTMILVQIPKLRFLLFLLHQLRVVWPLRVRTCLPSALNFRPSLSCWISVTTALFKRHPQRIARATFCYVTQSTELFRSTYSTCSTQSEHSEEELDRPFKFGGRPNCKNPSSNHVIRHHTSSRSLEVTESS